jgi:tetratricopeptide (TPR) repeat protein
MSGELQVARSLYTRGREMLMELGESVRVASSGIHMGNVELHGGDLQLAEHQMRRDVELLDRMGERYHLPAVAALLAKVIRDQGRDEEALPYLNMAEQLTSASDVSSQAFWRAVKAPILARQGRLAEAEELASVAVAMLKETEHPGFEADALVELAVCLGLAGKREDALRCLAEAISLHQRKGDLVLHARCVSMLERM